MQNRYGSNGYPVNQDYMQHSLSQPEYRFDNPAMQQPGMQGQQPMPQQHMMQNTMPQQQSYPPMNGQYMDQQMGGMMPPQRSYQHPQMQPDLMYVPTTMPVGTPASDFPPLGTQQQPAMNYRQEFEPMRTYSHDAYEQENMPPLPGHQVNSYSATHVDQHMMPHGLDMRSKSAKYQPQGLSRFAGMGAKSQNAMQQQQQQHSIGQQQPSAVSNSMSIRELAALVEQLPEGADPFDLIYDTLKAPEEEPTAQTTVMMRNIPPKYTQRQFLREIKSQGFDKCIDFLFLPSDSRGRGNVGYGFVNFVTTGFLSEFRKEFTEKKFKMYPTTTPISILMSTTQGWRENLCKVIKNNVLKRQVAPEFLPLLFCRSTGQEYPFPVPSDIGPPPPDAMRSETEGSAYEHPRQGIEDAVYSAPTSPSHNAIQHFRRLSGSATNPSDDMFRTMDPLAAFADNAHGDDARNPSYSSQPGTVPFSGSKLKGDAEAFVPAAHSIGRYNTQGTLGDSETGGSVMSYDVGMSMRPTFLKGKADDFYNFHGIESSAGDHQAHVQRLKDAKVCTNKDKLKLGQPRFPPRSPEAARQKKSVTPVILGHNGVPMAKSFHGRSFSPAVMENPVPRSKSAEDFCNIDVHKLSSERLQLKLKSTPDRTPTHASDNDSVFNVKIFSNPEIPEPPGVSRLWSVASENLHAMCEAITAGKGDKSGADGDSDNDDRGANTPPPLWKRTPESSRHPTPEQTPKKQVSEDSNTPEN